MGAVAALTVNGMLFADGSGALGNGGDVYLVGDGVTINGSVAAYGGAGTGGGYAEGGTVYIEADDGGISINANMDVSGGAGGSGPDGGAVIAETGGNITVAGGVELKGASDRNGGDGGDILLRSGGTVTVGANAKLDARGNDAHPGDEGGGARVELSGCSVILLSGVNVDVSGYTGGSIVFEGRESLTTSGVIDADGTSVDGSIMLSYRVRGTCSNDATQKCNVNADCPGGVCNVNNPTTVGTSFLTPPVFDHDRNLAPCD